MEDLAEKIVDMSLKADNTFYILSPQVLGLPQLQVDVTRASGGGGLLRVRVLLPAGKQDNKVMHRRSSFAFEEKLTLEGARAIADGMNGAWLSGEHGPDGSKMIFGALLFWAATVNGDCSNSGLDATADLCNMPAGLTVITCVFIPSRKLGFQHAPG